jgi:hypothetical protein
MDRSTGRSRPPRSPEHRPVIRWAQPLGVQAHRRGHERAWPRADDDLRAAGRSPHQNAIDRRMDGRRQLLDPAEPVQSAAGDPDLTKRVGPTHTSAPFGQFVCIRAAPGGACVGLRPARHPASPDRAAGGWDPVLRLSSDPRVPPVHVGSCVRARHPPVTTLGATERTERDTRRGRAA